jgi:hypothetical protein
MRGMVVLGSILGIVLSALAAITHEVVSAQNVDVFLANPTSDPLELARLVFRIGDDAVIESLSEGTRADARLLAVRAAPQLEGPERAIEALAAIAGGRDPDLAPAAAQSLLVIAHALDPQALDAREVMREELTPARVALSHVEADETARADIRRAAAIAIAALDAVGVPL